MFGIFFLCGLAVVQAEYAFEERQRMQADDDGMASPFIKLDEGINEPRMLSWAELRALEEDLRLSIDPVWSRPGRRLYRYSQAPGTIIYRSV